MDTDPVLSRIHRNLLSGSVKSDDPELRPYQTRASELRCVLWGSRVIVPKKGREAVITLLHEQHPGITRIKRLARGYVWWPGMDQELEVVVKLCDQCQQHQKSPAKAPMHPWEWPEQPWARIHIDYAGPFRGKIILVMVDSHSGGWRHCWSTLQLQTAPLRNFNQFLLLMAYRRFSSRTMGQHHA